VLTGITLVGLSLLLADLRRTRQARPASEPQYADEPAEHAELATENA
jgi:hypothetical protein